MTDDRYTVDDPPEEGEWVWLASLSENPFQFMRRAHGGFILEQGLIHRNPVSAYHHALRMLIGEDVRAVAANSRKEVTP
jgi:hypothetical protein